MKRTNINTFLPVIVLYKTKLKDSSTYNTLNVSLKSSIVADSIDVVVYDNSPEAHLVESTDLLNVVYYHDASNGGISKAYNYALSIAQENEIDWLLLLDQDSELPLDFIDNCLSDLRLHHDNFLIAAIVPTVYCGSKLISPCKVGWGGKLFPIKDHSTRVPLYEITAINSGALVKVAFLDSIGGFSNEFWLDMLDHWLFRTIYCKEMNVVVGHNKIYHDLSINNYSKISLERYQNIISAESHFSLTHRSVLHRTVFRIRLAVRVLKFIFIHKRTDLSSMTLSYVFKGVMFFICIQNG